MTFAAGDASGQPSGGAPGQPTGPASASGQPTGAASGPPSTMPTPRGSVADSMAEDDAEAPAAQDPDTLVYPDQRTTVGMEAPWADKAEQRVSTVC